jgi:hypothetical protein
MAHGRLYYLSLYLPDKVKLPFYSRTKKRRKEICDMIMASVASGEAKLYRAGLDSPEEDIRKSNDIAGLRLFTNVILKYYSSEKIDLSMREDALIRFFTKSFRGSEQVMITGDNTRMLIDTDKYRQVSLEGRKNWHPIHR